MSDVDRGWVFRELRKSLALLAADGETALTALPDGCCKPDELALDFDNFRSTAVSNFAVELPAELVAAMADLDAAFSAIRDEGWSEAAVRHSQEWAIVRRRAAAALKLLDQFGCFKA